METVKCSCGHVLLATPVETAPGDFMDWLDCPACSLDACTDSEPCAVCIAAMDDVTNWLRQDRSTELKVAA